MDFLEQVLPDGRTLRSALGERLKGHSYPPDMGRLASDLAAIRSLIKDTCDFSESQKRSILDALKPLQPKGKLRFRSSTNVEYSEQFSGAGLYDSYSGCLLDDLDGDTGGPSRCDPSEPVERGVFRALRRVFASFYNDNAVLERLRHGVNETTVGMAVLVHC
jgi:phosphoenolpyruvate synthase/pyruvate phosphate dikinase